jgi:hypothetical protein
VVTLGQPLGSDGDLGKTIESLVLRMCGALAPVKKPAANARDARVVA